MAKNKTPTKASQTKSSGYFVATFEKFPGVEIVLLSESECRARGIEAGKLPPSDMWSSEQQAALHELAEIIVQAAVDDIIRSVAPIQLGVEAINKTSQAVDSQ